VHAILIAVPVTILSRVKSPVPLTHAVTVKIFLSSFYLGPVLRPRPVLLLLTVLCES
jgi:hypothetical protein